MTDRPTTTDGTHLVVVPASPGPLVPLAQVEGARSDVDDVLDDLFGDVGDDGPGTTDALLLAGGTAAVIVSQIVPLPTVVLVGGLASMGLGAVLPIRSGLRRLRGRRREAKVRSLIGEGRLLDTRPVVVQDLVAAHRVAFTISENLTEVQQMRVRHAAHGLVTEVAALLDGHQLEGDTETRYTSDRLNSLRSLLAAAAEPSPDPDRERRRAIVEARIELDGVTSTAIDEAALLAADLRIERGE